MYVTVQQFDSGAIQRAITEWLIVGGDLVFPRGDYDIDAGVVVALTGDNERCRRIIGEGANLVSNTTDVMFTITAGGWDRYLEMSGFTFVGGAGEAGGLKVDGGAISQGLYGCKFADLYFDLVQGSSLHLTNNAFESVIDNVQGRTNQTTAPVFLVDSSTSGVPSSLTFRDCATSGGLVGLHVPSPIGDVHVRGGTYNGAQQYGVILENGFGGIVDGVHVENNWTSAADLESGGAGIKVANRGVITGCRGVTNPTTGKQRFAVETWTPTKMVVMGGSVSGCEYYALVGGPVGTETFLIACPDGVVGQFYDNNSGKTSVF